MLNETTGQLPDELPEWDDPAADFEEHVECRVPGCVRSAYLPQPITGTDADNAEVTIELLLCPLHAKALAIIFNA